MLNKKIENYLYKKYKNHFGKYMRLSSKPFISGDTFRKCCDHIFDETSKFNVNKVKFNDYIFVKSDYLSVFFKDFHPHIVNKYNLISHNSDESINREYIKFIDEKIINWYAQNIEENFSEKLKFIPIGLENRWHLKNGKIKNYKNILKRPIEKKYLLHASFSTSTHISRKKVFDIIKSNNYLKFNQSNRNTDYLETLAKSYFNICPRGNGWDTHRIWESFIFKTIPIVENNKFTKILVENNIPLLVIDEWQKLNEISQTDLLDFYKNIIENQDLAKFSTFDFWEKIIKFKN